MEYNKFISKCKELIYYNFGDTDKTLQDKVSWAGNHVATYSLPDLGYIIKIEYNKFDNCFYYEEYKKSKSMVWGVNFKLTNHY